MGMLGTRSLRVLLSDGMQRWRCWPVISTLLVRIHGPHGFQKFNVCLPLYNQNSAVITIVFIPVPTDQLNTYVQRTMKATPFELVFGQPPRSTVFPGVSGLVMKEDVEDLLTDGGIHLLQLWGVDLYIYPCAHVLVNV